MDRKKRSDVMDDPVKEKRQKLVRHDATVLLIDVGASSSQKTADGILKDLDLSKQVVDWIISRKVLSIYLCNTTFSIYLQLN